MSSDGVFVFVSVVFRFSSMFLQCIVCRKFDRGTYKWRLVGMGC